LLFDFNSNKDFLDNLQFLPILPQFKLFINRDEYLGPSEGHKVRKMRVRGHGIT